MSKSEVITTLPWHIEALVENLSVESEQGLRVLGLDPYSVLWQGMQDSGQVMTILINDQVAAIAGIVARDWGGQFWFNTGRCVVKYPIAFTKEIGNVFRLLRAGFSVVMNEAYENNCLTLNLAQHFGFKIVNTRPRGKNGELFHLLRWEAKHVYGG